ncbi:MAG: hypothetical protein IJ619_07930 [Eubacterium sp.]|nr:hypothetical protein [Eubacterium sp.]MCR5292266.1 hypothetical protein [Eubacterium sp.]
MKEFFNTMESWSNTATIEAELQSIAEFLAVLIVIAAVFYIWIKLRNYLVHRKDKDRKNRDFLD